MNIVIVQRIIFYSTKYKYFFFAAGACDHRAEFVAALLFDVIGSVNRMKYAREKNWIRIIKMRNVWRERLCWRNKRVSGLLWKVCDIRDVMLLKLGANLPACVTAKAQRVFLSATLIKTRFNTNSVLQLECEKRFHLFFCSHWCRSSRQTEIEKPTNIGFALFAMWPARFLLPATVFGFSVNKWSCFWFQIYTGWALGTHNFDQTHTQKRWQGAFGMPQQKRSLVLHAKLCRIINGKCLIDFYYKLCAECRQR